MFPAHFDTSTTSPAERRLYEALARQLDDEWVVLHHVMWIGDDEFGRPRDGEADFVVAHPYKGVLVLEVKGGRIRFDETTSHFISKNRDGCTGYLAHPFGKSRCKKERVCLHWLQMDVHRG
jgi:hypothetical protein